MAIYLPIRENSNMSIRTALTVRDNASIVSFSYWHGSEGYYLDTPPTDGIECRDYRAG